MQFHLNLWFIGTTKKSFSNLLSIQPVWPKSTEVTCHDCIILVSCQRFIPVVTDVSNSEGSYMHFSAKFNVSPVKITCRGWSFEYEEGLLGLERLTWACCPSEVLQSKEFTFEDIDPAKSLREPRSKEGPGPSPACPIWKLPEKLSLVSGKYKNVWEVLVTSLSSRQTREGESREMTEDDRWPSIQRKFPGLCCRWPPILQNRHFTFSMSLRSTALRSRI